MKLLYMALRELIFKCLEIRARAFSCLAAFLQQTLTQFIVDRHAQDSYLSFRHERRAIT